MLTGPPKILVKESNVVSIVLKLVLSTPKTHKKNVIFTLKHSFLISLTSPETPVKETFNYPPLM